MVGDANSEAFTLFDTRMTPDGVASTIIVGGGMIELPPISDMAFQAVKDLVRQLEELKNEK